MSTRRILCCDVVVVFLVLDQGANPPPSQLPCRYTRMIGTLSGRMDVVFHAVVAMKQPLSSPSCCYHRPFRCEDPVRGDVKYRYAIGADLGAAALAFIERDNTVRHNCASHDEPIRYLDLHVRLSVSQLRGRGLRQPFQLA
jgi:hypothetical protein